MSKKSCFKNSKISGLSLIEILVVLAIVVAITFFAVLNLSGTYRQKALENDAAKIVFSLRTAKEKSISQQDGNQWGVHFENSADKIGVYAVFAGSGFSTSTSIIYKNLDPSVQFIIPGQGSSVDIFFSKVYGLSSVSTSIIISLRSDSSNQRVIGITQNGGIQY